MNKPKGYIRVYSDGDDELSGIYADEVIVTRSAKYSRLLGPDGYRLPYEERQPFGFDLRGKNMND